MSRKADATRFKRIPYFMQAMVKKSVEAKARWIGGLGLLMMAVVPSLRKSVPGELVKPLANAIYRNYQRIIGALMLIILVTGGINIAYVNRLMKATNGEGFTNPYLIALGIKLFFVMCLMTLFLYNIIFPPEPEEQGRTGDEEKDPEGVPFSSRVLLVRHLHRAHGFDHEAPASLNSPCSPLAP